MSKESHDEITRGQHHRSAGNILKHLNAPDNKEQNFMGRQLPPPILLVVGAFSPDIFFISGH